MQVAGGPDDTLSSLVLDLGCLVNTLDEKSLVNILIVDFQVPSGKNWKFGLDFLHASLFALIIRIILVKQS
jgi:hypothetical protein